jgi:1-aminocyclopropane-1-carboxylate deaminase/D-cysteine desulfhydrase-like pyridoxal-dependent ACC family enzyme
VYLAVGTGGTLAGLATGASLTSWSPAFTGVCVAGDEPKHRAEVEALLAGLGELLDVPSHAADSLRFDGGLLGEGYGVPAASTLEAIQLCATTEGLLLDPVYTGKAMAALIADVRRGRAGSEPILFWHTGGSSGLFAYRTEVTPRVE